MRFIEPITREWLDNLIEYIDREFFFVSLFARRIDEFASLFHEELVLLLPYGSTEYVCFSERESSKSLYQLHDLLLIDGDTIGRPKDRLKGGMWILDCLASVFPIDELWDILHRTGSIE